MGETVLLVDRAEPAPPDRHARGVPRQRDATERQQSLDVGPTCIDPTISEVEDGRLGGAVRRRPAPSDPGRAYDVREDVEIAFVAPPSTWRPHSRCAGEDVPAFTTPVADRLPRREMRRLEGSDNNLLLVYAVGARV